MPRCAGRAALVAAFAPGSEGHALWPGLDVRPGDLKVPKRRSGAFAPGAFGLHDILQGRGIDTLIMTGTPSRVCCESTAWGAMMLTDKVFSIEDGNATFDDAEHNATLSAMAHTFRDVRDAAAAIGLIPAVQAAVA